MFGALKTWLEGPKLIESLWEMKRGLLRRPFILPVEAVQRFGWRNERWSELSYFENHPQAGNQEVGRNLRVFFPYVFFRNILPKRGSWAENASG